MARIGVNRRLTGMWSGAFIFACIAGVCAMMTTSIAVPSGVYEGFIQTQVGNALFTELQNKDANYVAQTTDGRWGWISHGIDMNYFHGGIVLFGLDPDCWYMVTLYSDDVDTGDLLGQVGYFGFVEKDCWADIAMFKSDSYGYAKVALPDANLELVTDPVFGLLPTVILPLGEYKDVCVNVKYVGIGADGWPNWTLVSSGGADTLDNLYEMEKLNFDLTGCPYA